MLELEHIQKAFDGVPVLKDLSLQVEDGEIVSILGPSGCGKTTLLNIILGIVDADQGEIRYSGEDLTRTPMEKRGFNIVFQDYALFPNLNVQQNITYGLRNKPGISSREEVDELIDLLGLREHLGKRIDQLSGGQKQRVALARTLVMKPRILLLDEPLSALDGVIKESIKDRIKTIAREYHLTTIIVTMTRRRPSPCPTGCSSSIRGPSPSTPSRTRSSTSPGTTSCASSSSASWRSSAAISTPCSATARSWPARLFEERAMRRKNWELKGIFWIITLLFVGFLAAPILLLLGKSLVGEGGFTWEFYASVVTREGFLTALGNSFAVAAASAVTATVIAFLMAYAVHYTGLPRWAKRLITAIATLPMFLPTITYGFAIIYSFGRQGLLTRLLGRQFFDIYGFGGLLVGYVIYTIPVAFLLIHNTMGFVDKKTIIVSKAMGDRDLATFWIAILRPLLGTLAGAFIQAFFLCFTDFGIPASVGGGYEVIATLLYNQMLGGIPDFNRGAVIAMILLIPSIGSICILQLLERFNIRYTRISQADLRKNPLRDTGWGVSSTAISVAILSIFAVIFVVPLVEQWPYQTSFSLEHFAAVFTDSELITVYWHSLVMALLTAFLGTLAAYGAALITARSTLPPRYKRVIESIALVTNAIPGMVLGVAYLFLFSGSGLQNTLLLMILCNIVHYFSTPYLMMKNSLSKMNAGWETTAMLMGDSWLQTILRVVTPNALSSLIEVFSYYFINSMVTISALIFIAGARTMVLTTMIKQLQYVNRFNEVFVLSLLILATNLIAKGLFSCLASYKASHPVKERRSIQLFGNRKEAVQ